MDIIPSMNQKEIKSLLAEADAAYGSANAHVLGDLVERLSAALAEVQEAWQRAQEALHEERNLGSQQQQTIKDLQEEISKLETKSASFEDELAFLRTKVFGSTSEKIQNAELHGVAATTAVENLDGDADGSVPEADAKKDKERKRRARNLSDKQKPTTSKKTKTSEKVEQEAVRHPLPDDLDLVCPLCGDEVKDQGLGHKAKEIDLAPSRVIEREHLLHKGSCGCGALRLLMPPPVRGVPQTIFSPRFVAQVIIDKFVAHLPCNRQAKLFAMQGLKIHRNRLIGLILRSWLQLEPLVDRIRELSRMEPYQSCDESPVRVIAKEGKQTRYLWCLVSSLAVTFTMTEQRNKETAKSIIGPKDGALTSDRLSIYRKLFEGKAESGCMAHCRRRFWFALPTAGDEAMPIIETIAELYEIERQAKDLQLEAKERQALRQKKSAPILDRLKAMVSALDPPPRSRLGEAKTYTLNHWDALTYFIKDGMVEIDNNHTEARLRVPKLGWKNWLAPQSEIGCDAVAGHYTLLATLDLYGIDPSAYLSDVLGKLSRGHPSSRLDELLPWNWQIPETSGESRPSTKRTEHHKGADIINLSHVRRRLRRVENESKAFN